MTRRQLSGFAGIVVALAAASTLVVASASTSSAVTSKTRPATRADVIGKTFVAHVYRHKGKVHRTVRGSRFALSFSDDPRIPGDEIGIGTPCNGMGGTFTIVKRRLHIGNVTSTTAYCSGRRGRQENLLSRLISHKPKLKYDGRRLTVTKPGTRIVFHPVHRHRPAK